MKQYAIEIAYRGNVTAKNKEEAIKDFVSKISNGKIKSEAKYVIIPTLPITTVEARLIEWLMTDGYSHEEAQRQINEATITSKLNVYTIIYNNGVMDKVRITQGKIELLKTLNA